MKTLLLGLMAGAVWVLLRGERRNRNVVPAEEAAAKLREAWAGHHSAA